MKLMDWTKKMFSSYKWYLLVAVFFFATAASFLALDISRQRHTLPGDKAQAEQNKMISDTSLIILLSTLGIIGTSLSNPLIRKYHEKTMDALKSVEQSVTDLKTENAEQHIQLFQDLKDTKSAVKIVVSQSDLNSLLRSIMVEPLSYSPDEKMDSFLNSELEAVIEFCKEVMESRFDHDAIHQINIKISLAAKKQRKLFIDTFGEVLACEYGRMQRHLVDKFMQEITDIATDEMFNSKNRRFSNSAQGFLEKLLSGTVRLYMVPRV